MLNLNKLLCNRLGISWDNKLELEDLNTIIEKTAKTIPFENLSIINSSSSEITPENLLKKIIERNEGGLCYELNSLFYFFLSENGYNAKLIRCMRYDYTNRSWSAIGKTHVAIIINHNDKLYLVDVGFGGYSPLKIVPLNGDKVTSENGEFKVINVSSGYGDFIFCMKMRYKDTDWKIGYAFDSKNAIQDITELNEVQKLTVEHLGSNFNKRPIVTKFTDNGNLTLTDTSFTEWVNGEMKKTEIIDKEMFCSIAKHHFGLFNSCF
ncbi:MULTISPECIES: arylamine N-acetyltransferase [unclassified Paenibacillus]|uniref:arylamine N-acetyltransferase family protein n=1 Tax=unclassified Paenibacillus TaxID=185978 RepID=UPI0038355D4A